MALLGHGRGEADRVADLTGRNLVVAHEPRQDRQPGRVRGRQVFGRSACELRSNTAPDPACQPPPPLGKAK